MRLRTLLRSSAAVYIVPFLILFISTAIARDLTAFTTAYYWPSATGRSLHALPFICTICAGLAAWEGARLTRGNVFGQTAARSPLAIVTPVLAPVALGGLLTYLVALAQSASSADTGVGMPDPLIMLVAVLMITMNTLLGYSAGLKWQAVISVPVTLVGASFLNAYPASWSIVWLRHLVGTGLADCCAVDQVVDTRALWPAILFAGGIIAACLIGIMRRRSPRTIRTITAIVLACTGLAVATAVPVPVTPVADRPTGELRCEEASGIQVCLWPEVRNQDKIRPTVAAVRQKLTESGVQVPTVFTMAATPKQGEAKLGVDTKPRGADVLTGVALSVMPPVPSCAQNGPYPAATAQPPTAAWLLLTAGVPAEALRDRFDPAAVELATRIRTLPPEEQRSWYQFNHEAMQGCSIQPQLTAGARAS
ncbi:DUF7224 domain-containing protein [Streptomyces erythrochromogenes]|uniref:DUF7224 domain-containing protein n=1 Tax=Streptomyces erythrochromogenes TaxID=285574 RepID=UPI0037FD075B